MTNVPVRSKYVILARLYAHILKCEVLRMIYRRRNNQAGVEKMDFLIKEMYGLIEMNKKLS